MNTSWLAAFNARTASLTMVYLPVKPSLTSSRQITLAV